MTTINDKITKVILGNTFEIKDDNIMYLNGAKDIVTFKGCIKNIYTKISQCAKEILISNFEKKNKGQFIDAKSNAVIDSLANKEVLYLSPWIKRNWRKINLESNFNKEEIDMICKISCKLDLRNDQLFFVSKHGKYKLRFLYRGYFGGECMIELLRLCTLFGKYYTILLSDLVKYSHNMCHYIMRNLQLKKELYEDGMTEDKVLEYYRSILITVPNFVKFAPPQIKFDSYVYNGHLNGLKVALPTTLTGWYLFADKLCSEKMVLIKPIKSSDNGRNLMYIYYYNSKFIENYEVPEAKSLIKTLELLGRTPNNVRLLWNEITHENIKRIKREVIISMIKYVEDGKSNNRDVFGCGDLFKKYNVIRKEIKPTMTFAAQLKASHFNHNQSTVVEKLRMKEDMKEIIKHKKIICPKPSKFILPSSIEELRLKTLYDYEMAGLECHNCIKDYYVDTNYRANLYFIVRKNKCAAQIYLQPTIRVVQCYDEFNHITPESKKFENWLKSEIKNIKKVEVKNSVENKKGNDVCKSIRISDANGELLMA